MTNESPTPEMVEKAISRLHGRADCSSIFGDVKKSMGENEELAGTIRAHIAALEHKHDDLVTRCVQAESDRDALEAKLAEQIREDEMRLINHCVKVLGNNSKAHIHAEAEFLTKIAELEAENKRLAAELDFTERRMKHEADERDKADDQNKRLLYVSEWVESNWDNQDMNHADFRTKAFTKAKAALAQTGEK